MPNFKKVSFYIILCQCSGLIPHQLFQNGIFLTYLKQLSVSEEWIVLLIQTPNFLSTLLMIPLAYKADLIGKKKLGQWGNVIQLLSLVAIALIPFVKGPIALWMGMAIVFYALGSSLFAGGWFSLLEPIVPAAKRAKFFSHLRITWQLVGLIFTAMAMKWIAIYPELSAYQWLYVFVALLMVIRIVFYNKIPEHEVGADKPTRFRDIIKLMKDRDGFVWFNVYSFLICFAASSVIILLNLEQKSELGFSNDAVVRMGMILFVGSLLGYFLGGRLTDRWGVKKIFNVANFCFPALMFLVAFHHKINLPVSYVMGFVTFVFGALVSAHSIGHTVAMFVMIPREFKSVGTATSMTVFTAGASLSAMMTAALLKSKITLWEFNSYQTIIIIYAVFLMFLAAIFVFKPVQPNLQT